MTTDSKSGDVQITLRNGDKVKVNDHVYCSPAWTVRDGTPYSIARIMEFLPPENKTNKGSSSSLSVSTAKGKGKETFTRARLAWYYRPSDVSDRNVADSRLLLAAIYSEICDISQLRAKCYVIHRDKLQNVADWKRKPDRFYFHRLFDPYIKREFEVLLSTDVRNLPQHIKDVLVSRYEYVVAEKEVVTDLIDDLRLCETCTEWCAHTDAVQCARCRRHFHMTCVNPPLQAKPARGYGWTCAPCSRRHEDRVDAGEAGLQAVDEASRRAPAIALKTMRGRGRPKKEKPASGQVVKEEEMQVKHYKMWPFRYFGLYTIAEDTMDPDDLIFPRAATRVGPKYQVTVPPFGETIPPATANSTSSGASVTNLPPEEERGGDSTIEVLSVVNHWKDDEVSKVEQLMPKAVVRKDQVHSVDWLTEYIRRICQARASNQRLESVSMKSVMRLEKWKKHETRYTDREWNDDEVSAFVDGIMQFGAELRSVRDEVGTRSMPEIVRFYGKWKNGRLREENARLREPDAYKKAKVPRSGAASPASMSGPVSDDECSIVDLPTSGPSFVRTNNYCAACRTRDTDVWWKAPKGLSTPYLCDSCGVNWRKYADLSSRPTTREETSMNSSTPAPLGSVKAREKREGTPLTAPVTKKAKVATSSGSIKSTPPLKEEDIRCLSCYCWFPPGKDVLKCKQCGVTVHAGACGALIEPGMPSDSWICDLCENEKTQEFSLANHCLLCPKPTQREIAARGGKRYPPTDQYLRACKPTEGQGWVHALCSVFIPELQYSDASRLRIVEGVSTIPGWRWQRTCVLCTKTGGAVVQCANCPKHYHVSCAWKYGHKFGFEIQPVKSSRRDMTSMVTFKRETGLMNAVICCKDHVNYRRQTFDICDKNEAGETALQVYARTYKQAPVGQTHSLLRKAQRLDQILEEMRLANEGSVNGSKTGSPTPPAITGFDEEEEEQTPECANCRTTWSPRFWPSGKKTLCHRCYFHELLERKPVEQSGEKDAEAGLERDGKEVVPTPAIVSPCA